MSTKGRLDLSFVEQVIGLLTRTGSILKMETIQNTSLFGKYETYFPRGTSKSIHLMIFFKFDPGSLSNSKAGLSHKPWFSVLGNHDWGGFKFGNAWDQQMSYTWASNRWVLPAPYYKTSVSYADLGFDVDYYFLDSNFVDAKPPEEDPNHNMCSRKNNKPSATCGAADGPTSVDSCPAWFAALWAEQKDWVTQLLPKSQATWQIAVTHFPCGHEQGFYKGLANMGLDLLVTGHRHDQELLGGGFQSSFQTCLNHVQPLNWG